MNTPKKRRLSRSDVTGVRWLLTAAVSIAVFVTLVQHYFSRDWFGLPAILGILAISILLGSLFAAIWLAAVTLTVGIEMPKSTGIDPTQETRSHKILNIEEPIEIDEVPMLWREQLHTAAVSLYGLPWNAFKAISLALVVVVPSIVYTLKAGSTSLSTVSPTFSASVFVLGFLVVVAMFAIAAALHALLSRVAAARDSKPSTFRLTRDSLQIGLPDQGETSIPWNNFDRVIRTSRIIGLVTGQRLVLVLPRRVVDMKLINLIQEIVEDGGN